VQYDTLLSTQQTIYNLIHFHIWKKLVHLGQKDFSNVSFNSNQKLKLLLNKFINWERSGNLGTSWLLSIGNSPFFFLLSYSLLGAGLKYIDAAFDEKTLNKKVALLISPFLGVLWFFTMLIDSASAVLLSAIVLGVLLKGKIDNIAHMVGVFIIIFMVMITGLRVMPLPLILLTACACMDEVGNDIIDRKETTKGFLDVFLKYFFGKRWLLKMGVLYLVLIELFPMYLLVALIFFDESYLLVEEYGRSRLKRKKR